MLREDTGEFTNDRPWVSEGTLERFEDDGGGGVARASSRLGNTQNL